MDISGEELIKRIAKLVRQNQDLLLENDELKSKVFDLSKKVEDLEENLKFTTSKKEILSSGYTEKPASLKFEMATVMFANIHGFAKISKEMDSAVNKAVKETIERLNGEAGSREELLRKEFDGERNVLSTKINSAEKTIKEQGEQIAKLSLQMEKAYQKVQDIAVKAIEGSSDAKSLANLQHLLNEQIRKQPQEK